MSVPVVEPSMVRKVRSIALGASLLVTFVAMGSSSAQDLSDRELRAFEEHVRRGGNYLQEERYAEAVEELERARAIVDHPRVAVTIARAHEQWGQCVEARKRARELSLRSDLDEGAQRVVVDIMSATRSCAQDGRLMVGCRPEQAIVEISGRPAMGGQCPADLELPAGRHTVVVTAAGYVREEVSVELEALETKEISLVLGRASEPVAAAEGSAGAGSSMRPTAYGALGAGAVLLTVGVVSDLGAHRRLEAMLGTEDPDRLNALEAEASRARSRTLGLYGGGAGLVAVGGVLWYLSRQPAGDPAKLVYVYPVEAGVGAGMRVSW
jgi:hypothetical protein